MSYSPGGPLGIGGGANQQKMDSDYASVQEQTGIFAGKGGFDITVGNKTTLEGAVIASEADASQNHLDTGTLEFKDIENHADFRVDSSGISVSTGGSIGDIFLGNMAGAALNNANNEGDANSTTHSAVAPGEITIRDTEHQTQDIEDLSRDTEHANEVLAPIFDKEKEQARLDEQKAISEIRNQVQDILRTEGQIRAEQAKKDPEALMQAELELRREGKNPSEKDIQDRAAQTAMQDWGTGGKYQQLAQAVMGALDGISAGDWAKALAGGAPYLATLIKDMAGDNEEMRYAGHAILGGVLAYLNGNNALSGAVGAVTGEALSQYLLAAYYPGRQVEDLTEDEKQRLSGLSTIAAGVVGGMVGSGFADAIAGAQTGKNAVENNQFARIQAAQAAEQILKKEIDQLIKNPKPMTDSEKALVLTVVSALPYVGPVVRVGATIGSFYFEFNAKYS